MANGFLGEGVSLTAWESHFLFWGIYVGLERQKGKICVLVQKCETFLFFFYWFVLIYRRTDSCFFFLVSFSHFPFSFSFSNFFMEVEVIQKFTVADAGEAEENKLVLGRYKESPRVLRLEMTSSSKGFGLSIRSRNFSLFFFLTFSLCCRGRGF